MYTTISTQSQEAVESAARMCSAPQWNGNEYSALATAVAEPIQLSAQGRGQQLMDWARAHRDVIEGHLKTHGAVLLPGLKLNNSQQFQDLLSIVFDAPLLEYRNRSTPRTQLRGQIYTSTEYPAEESIPLHNENAYSHAWALRLGFLSLLPASHGGATPIADSARVYQRIPVATRERFERHGVMYLRHYGAVDLPWSEVFQSDDRDVVSAYCESHQIDYEWLADGGLRTREIRQASIAHPDTGAMLWFNQAHLFHISNYRPEVRQSLLASLGWDLLPRNACYGDGAPIADQDLQAIRQAYAAETYRRPWQMGDVLLLDNMRYAHGRDPFQGPRKVLVGMARSYPQNDPAQTQG